MQNQIVMNLIERAPHTRDFSHELGEHIGQRIGKLVRRDSGKLSNKETELLEYHKAELATTQL